MFHTIMAETGVCNVPFVLLLFPIGFLLIFLKNVSDNMGICQPRNAQCRWHSTDHFNQASKGCLNLVFVFHLATSTGRIILVQFVAEEIYLITVQIVTMAKNARHTLHNDCGSEKSRNVRKGHWRQRTQVSRCCQPIDLESEGSLSRCSVGRISNTIWSFGPIIKKDSIFPAIPIQTFVGKNIFLGKLRIVSDRLRLKKSTHMSGIV
jgi:hypothetical protein